MGHGRPQRPFARLFRKALDPRSRQVDLDCDPELAPYQFAYCDGAPRCDLSRPYDDHYEASCICPYVVANRSYVSVERSTTATRCEENRASGPCATQSLWGAASPATFEAACAVYDEIKAATYSTDAASCPTV